MKVLTLFGKAWRDYLFANCDGIHNDAKDFMIRIELIRDSQDQILETMLEDTPNMELVAECKGEIAFQRVQLEDMINEFVNFEDIPADEKLSADEILMDLCDAATNSYLYEIASEWKVWGEKSHKICEKLNELYGYGIGYIHDDLCKLILSEIINNDNDKVI
jgi:hypothetical protein